MRLLPLALDRFADPKMGPVHVEVRLQWSEHLASWIGPFHMWSLSLPCAQGSVFYRLLVDPAVDLMLVVQVVRGWEVALFAARAVGQEEVRERNPNNQADKGSAACPTGNKAPKQCTERDECQAKNHSEMFHDTCCLSSQERTHADLFLSLP